MLVMVNVLIVCLWEFAHTRLQLQNLEEILRSLLNCFKKAKKHPNLTRLDTSQMPSGRGRKGGVGPQRKRKQLSFTVDDTSKEIPLRLEVSRQ